MTISEIQTEAKELEKRIARLASDFEHSTGMLVSIHAYRSGYNNPMKATAIVSLPSLPAITDEADLECPF